MTQKTWSEEENGSLDKQILEGKSPSEIVIPGRTPRSIRSHMVFRGLFVPDPTLHRAEWPAQDQERLLRLKKEHPGWGAATLLKKGYFKPPYSSKVYTEDAISQQLRRMKKQQKISGDRHAWVQKAPLLPAEVVRRDGIIEANLSMPSKALQNLLAKAGFKMSGGNFRKIRTRIRRAQGQTVNPRGKKSSGPPPEKKKYAPSPSPAQFLLMKDWMKSYGRFFSSEAIARMMNVPGTLALARRGVQKIAFITVTTAQIKRLKQALKIGLIRDRRVLAENNVLLERASVEAAALKFSLARK